MVQSNGFIGCLFDLPTSLLDPYAAEDRQKCQTSAKGGAAESEARPDDAESAGKGKLVATSAESETLSKHHPEREVQPQHWSQSGATCITCGIGYELPRFEGPEDQREHFRSDWHRCNVKRRAGGQRALSEAEFDSMIDAGGDDVDSISGSDSESDVGDDRPNVSIRTGDRLHTCSPKAVISSGDGRSLLVWRCLVEELQPRGVIPAHTTQAASPPTPEESLLQMRAGGTAARWLVILASGGHFAGAVFQWQPGRAKGKKVSPATLEAVAHKTFHKYVVRAKAGGRQSVKDATGKTIKSAGSAMRRANEASLAKDIRATLHGWKDEIAAVGLVFVHASQADTATLFFGDDAPLSRFDTRLRRIPFSTRRPTLSETKRVAQSLANVWELFPDEEEVAKVTTAAEDIPTEPHAGELEMSRTLERVAEANEPAAVQVPEVEDSELHVASKAGDHTKVKELLEGGADPCVRDARSRTPYAVAQDKSVRDTFRRFMAAEPERWDYTLAGVPSALTQELEEQQESRKAEKDAKMKKDKAEKKKAAKERKKRAEEEARETAKQEIEAAATAAAAQAARLKLVDTKKKDAVASKKATRAGQEASKRREVMAAAAEARMKALQAATAQQKLH